MNPVRTKWLIITVIVIIVGMIMFQFSNGDSPTKVDEIFYGGYELVETWAIPGDCFVQGLAHLNSTHIFMTCGGYGSSRIVIIHGFEFYTALIVRDVYWAPSDMFLEGCTVVDGKLFVLTWREHKLLEFNTSNIGVSPLIHDYTVGEGWGIAYDGRKELWTSNGSNILTVLDSLSLHPIRTCELYIGETPVVYLNELEFIGEFLYANIYIPAGISNSNFIVEIDVNACKVQSVYLMENLNKETNQGSVMNGISHSASHTSSTVLVTGKNWKEIHQVRMDKDKTHQDVQILKFLTLKLGFR